MFRILGALTVLVSAAITARAHFVFVIPDTKDPSKIIVVLSEELEPDAEVSAAKLSTLKLTCRDASGKQTAVEHKTGAHELTATLPGSGARIVYGTVNYGVMQRGDAKPYLLAYHPKALVGTVSAEKTILGEKAVPVELVPVASGSEVKFQFLVGGKPAIETEVTIIKPNGEKAKSKTDKNGLTQGYPAKGRYGVWAKSIVMSSGEFGGKKYDEVRHYATLVVGFPVK